MIEDWRRGWGAQDLPFLFVQLAGFLPPSTEPAESNWALLRESQSAALALPGTAQVVLIDAGEADDVHPRDKQVVGERLALAARKVAHGEEIVFSGPAYRGHEVESGRVVIDFDHVGGGLVARDAPRGGLAGFAVAGADRRFVWAETKLDEERVVVWSDLVPEPGRGPLRLGRQPRGREPLQPRGSSRVAVPHRRLAGRGWPRAVAVIAL